MYCTLCGSHNENKAYFCSNCGTVLNKEIDGDAYPAKDLDQEIEGDAYPAKDLDNKSINNYSDNRETTNQITQQQKIEPSQHDSRYIVPSKYQIDGKTKTMQKEKPEVDNPWYYLFALIWPIGIFIYLFNTDDKPILKQQMKEILSFSIIFTVLFLWLVN